MGAFFKVWGRVEKRTTQERKGR